MAAWGFREKEPQINADERRFNPATYISAVHRKERKAQPQCGTRMTRIERIFTDTANPCASASSAQSVFHYVCFFLKKPAPETEVSSFIRVHTRFLKIAPAMQGANGEAE